MAVPSAPAGLARADAADAAAVAAGAPALAPAPPHLAVVAPEPHRATALVHALAPAPG